MDLQVQVSIPYRNVAPTNVAVNVWSFEAPDDTTPVLLQIQSFLSVFYSGLTDWYSPCLSMDVANIKMYRRSDLEPRAPIFDNSGSFGITNQTNEPLPEEVAAVMSFRGVRISGQPQARHRGRLFLGPLGSQVCELGSNGRSVISRDFIDTVVSSYLDAAEELSSAGLQQTIWSKTNGEAYPAVEWWMDDSFDTQRRRGPASSFKQPWTLL